MFALVDCNSFFVSCERVFQPHLEGKPVIVLSSNDGCAIARSHEAKALGIKMGDPLFKIKDIVKKHHVHVFSSNFSLYGDMSSRVMHTLKTMSPSLEVYSVDEAFLDLSSLPHRALFDHGCHIKSLVKQWTGIPVSVGVAPTKTLAKIANHLAKKQALGCCVLLNPREIEEALKNFPLQEVWGIGSQWSQKLSRFGLQTAFDLAQADMGWIRKTFNVILARTALELKGISCLSLEAISSPKKTMISSRSFGVSVSSFDTLREAMSFHASVLARRLRKEKSKASLISVSLYTTPFDKKGVVYANSKAILLPFPSQDTSLLIKAAIAGLEKIFKEGLCYKKAGVRVLNLSPESQSCPTLFTHEDFEDRPKRKTLLKTMDKLNHFYGKGTLVFASEGMRKSWAPKALRKSPAYTQCWNQLLTVG